MTASKAQIAAIILAAGHGTRMKSAMPKVLHQVGGLAMLGHVIATTQSLVPSRLAVVIGDHAPEVGDVARNLDPMVETFVQSPPQGTGDAVVQAMPGLEGFGGVVFVLFADSPLVTAETLAKLASAVESGAGVAVLGFVLDNPGAYGRLVTDAAGSLERIVEAKDASVQELAITLCNSGVMAIKADVLHTELSKIENKNAKAEYYLTDIVALARAAGHACAVVEGSEEEVLGVNSRVELAQAEQIFQRRARHQAMLEGATLLDPSTVYFSHDTKLGKDVVIGQNVVFGVGVSVEDGVHIHAFSHLEGASVRVGASVGPFARLRPGADLGEQAKVGNFVEIKKSTLGKGAKVSHLSYIGDATIGAGANIGAGTITCNYDGFNKFQTNIGEGAFVGSNSSLVAPITIGKGAYVGSGSVVTKDVEADALAVARGRQIAKSGWAAKFRAKFKK
ncbi:MAG: bifunctional UDP-N-acetylglucosamine diphosphorylase/glucosamine-1-phosphate N-acetyltransferase GlmU [Parvularculaceae bacterium]